MNKLCNPCLDFNSVVAAVKKILHNTLGFHSGMRYLPRNEVRDFFVRTGQVFVALNSNCQVQSGTRPESSHEISK
jgi:hypothetical protein